MLDDLIEMLSRPVAIDSVNPSLVPGAAGDGKTVGLIAAARICR
jgi:hypothetical protein